MDGIAARKDAADALVGCCLAKLVELGKVALEQVNQRWYVSFDDSRLNGKGFAGGATLDRNDHPVLYLSPELTVDAMIWIIAHESVHLMQICKGELIPMFGYQIWKGQPYETLPADDPSYFDSQPWEKEAHELHPILLEHLRSKAFGSRV
jgi:hypothetical protein